MKPGFLTSEFALALIVVLVAAVAALIQVWRGQLDGMGALGLMSAALAATGYAYGRSRVKNGHTNGNGNGNGSAGT
jgi:hypothetical protein